MTAAGITALHTTASPAGETAAVVPLGVSDDLLMGRFQAGDGAAFEQLYRRYRQRLFSFLLRLIGRRAEAEEVFQDVWMAVIRGAARYQAGERFASWLFTIAHRRAADSARKSGRLHASDAVAEALGDAAAEPLPDQLLAAADLARALVAGVEALPWSQREAFLLHADGGFSLEEIAQLTDVPRETAKSRLRYATRRLRQIVDASQ